MLLLFVIVLIGISVNAMGTVEASGFRGDQPARRVTQRRSSYAGIEAESPWCSICDRIRLVQVSSGARSWWHSTGEPARPSRHGVVDGVFRRGCRVASWSEVEVPP